MKVIEGNKDDIHFLDSKIIEYNLAALPYPKNPPWELLIYKMQNNNTTIAGIYGHLIMNNILSIGVLFVEKNFRGCGYGKLLLKKTEQTALQKGAYLAQLDTFDFQGLDFYKKAGYLEFGKLEDCPAPGHSRFYLAKQLES